MTRPTRDAAYAHSQALLEQVGRLHPKTIDLSLGRIETLLSKLQHPERRLPPVIHVAGTNGKGSVLAFLRAFFAAAGLRSHSFVSPHLIRFHERIRLAGEAGEQPIGEDRLVDVLTRTKMANGNAPITFFEITTAAALLAFSEEPADVLLLETGLGGRLDATNVVDKPALTVITPVSMDHMDWLGASIKEIAFEKAGILKPGVPAIIGPQPAAASQVIARRAREIGAPLFAYGTEWDVYTQGGRLIFLDEAGLEDLPMPRLHGAFQIENAGMAIASARQFSRHRFQHGELCHGLEHVQWPGRMQLLGAGPLTALAGKETEVWVDGGHNAAAGEALARTLAALEERSAKPVCLICAMMKRKDPLGFLRPFHGLVRQVLTLDVPYTQAGLNAAELAAIAADIAPVSEPAKTLGAAIQRCEQLQPGPKRIVITGSLYLAGAALDEQGAST